MNRSQDMKLITFENNDMKISKKLFSTILLPPRLFWAYCYFIIEPEIKDKKYALLLRQRMIGNRLAKYRKRKRLKELGLL
jgi:hypothetical protein